MNTSSRPPGVIPSLCRGYQLPTVRKSYTKRDVSLYALGIGLASSDQSDPEELVFVYENSDGFSPLPSFPVVIPPIESVFDGLLSCPGMPDFNPMMLLHGDEKLIIHSTLPTDALVECQSKIVDVADKKKGAVITIEAVVYEIDSVTDERSSAPLCTVVLSVFIRGIGGFGEGPSIPPSPPVTIPSNPPDIAINRHVPLNAALIYRLSGDLNPLHVDPDMAALGGFAKPILHGLCSFGIATHVLVKLLGNNEGDSIQEIQARFSSPVTPGDDLEVKAWVVGDQGTTVVFVVYDLSSKKECLSLGQAVFRKPIKITRKAGRAAL